MVPKMNVKEKFSLLSSVVLALLCPLVIIITIIACFRRNRIFDHFLPPPPKKKRILCMSARVHASAGMLGVSGAFLSCIQLSVLERDRLFGELSKMHSNASVGVLLALIAFALALFIFYSLMPYALQHTSAVIINLG